MINKNLITVVRDIKHLTTVEAFMNVTHTQQNQKFMSICTVQHRVIFCGSEYILVLVIYNES
jgi:hypothetical protein